MLVALEEDGLQAHNPDITVALQVGKPEVAMGVGNQLEESVVVWLQVGKEALPDTEALLDMDQMIGNRTRVM